MNQDSSKNHRRNQDSFKKHALVDSQATREELLELVDEMASDIKGMESYIKGMESYVKGVKNPWFFGKIDYKRGLDHFKGYNYFFVSRYKYHPGKNYNYTSINYHNLLLMGSVVALNIYIYRKYLS